MTDTTWQTWVESEFFGVEVGDARRLRRLHSMAVQAAERPAGQISAVFTCSADRQGAYGFLENQAIKGEALAQATHRATATRCRDEPYVFVPLDGSSLTLTDTLAAKDFGSVGSHWAGARGLKVMTALAVTRDGIPLGICHQAFWNRPKNQADINRERRKLEDKETRHWVEGIAAVCARFSEAGCQSIPWFQVDREGDSWPLIGAGLQPGRLITIRARHNRRLQLASDKTGPGPFLWPYVQHQPVIGSYNLTVPDRPGRSARTATMAVRCCQVTLDLRDKRTGGRHAATLWAVLASEESSVPEHETPLEWLLLTTRPVQSLGEANEVIIGYTQRWRIEEFHRIWKSGACDVEDTQLHSRQAVVKWAVILASVAIRLLRLSYLGRHQPSQPASIELTPVEIAAIRVLKRHKPSKSTQVFTIGQAVQCLAELGGYTGKSSGGPPGPTVLARGLKRMQALADGLSILMDA